tara:strand:- start:42 stop:686 length:645 start_codon:yes stop_codon:yes gene_type:complete
LTKSISHREIGDTIDKISAYIGTEPLSNPQKAVLLDFLVSEFRTVSPDEMLEAVKGAISGRLQVPRDITRISKMSAGWFGSILQGYKIQRSLNRSRPEPITTENVMGLLQEFGGGKGKDQEYYDGLIAWHQKNGQMPYAWAWGKARKYAQTLPGFNITASDEVVIKGMAKEIRMKMPKKWGTPARDHNKISQNDLDKAVMFLHIKRITKNKEDE